MALGGTAIISARALGPEGRGVFAADYSLLFISVMVGSLGIGTGGRRLLAIGTTTGVTLREFQSATFRLMVAQVALATASALWLLPIFGAGRSGAENLAFVAACVCTLGLTLSREALFGVGDASGAEAILAMSSIATFGGASALALSGQLTVPRLLWAYAGAASVGQLATWRRAAKRSPCEPAAVRSGSFGRLAVSGRPVLVLLVAQAIATRGDRLVIGAVSGSADLGHYAVAVTVMELLSLGALALGNVAFQGLAIGSLSSRSMAHARRYSIGATAVAAVALIVASPWLIRIAFGSRFAEAVAPLQVLAIAAVPFGAYQIHTQHLIARGRAKYAAALAAASALAMVGGDVLIVPRSGIVGAAWVSVVVFSLSAGLARYLVRVSEVE